jgi:hypothetical protein
VTLISDSYEQSRQRFRNHLGSNPQEPRQGSEPVSAGHASIQSLWPASRLTSQALPYEDDLSIDWISANALTTQDKLFVLTTGEHGIEGYVGAALLELFIQEYLPRLDPQTTGILLVHAINPWGMKHWKRNNPDNVDLNRNYIEGDFSALANINPDYPKLAPFLSPQKGLGNLALEKLLFIDQTLHSLVRFGIKRTREATLMGQYIMPKGIYFGGQEIQPETRILSLIFCSISMICSGEK